MQRMIFAILAASLIIQPVGCGDYEPADLPSPPMQEAEKQPEAKPAPPSPAEPAETLVEEKTPEPVAEPEPEPEPVPEPEPRQPAPEYVPPSPSPAIVAPQMPISLDLGVALGQPGPEGTMMMFSVKYEFVSGSPDPKAKYAWVIERAKGAPAKLSGPLQNSGELNTAISGWRPEHGPFKSHIEDAKGKRLSDSIEMRQ